MTANRPAAVVVLAAGGGTRMKSSTPKVLHRIGGRTLLSYAIAAARGVDPQHLVVVVRHDRDLVAEHVRELAPDAVVTDQDEVPGTGRAVECALSALPPDIAGTVLVMMSDTPLLTAQTLSDLYDEHRAAGAALSLVTVRPSDPTGYGRIVRGDDGGVDAIVEERDASDQQRGIDEVNGGCYSFEAADLRAALTRIGTDNAQGEKYLTDAVAVLREAGRSVRPHTLADYWQAEGVNDRAQLAALGAELNRRVLRRWMLAGVTVVDPATTWIDVDARLGRDVVIHPHTQVLGSSTVGDDVTLGPDTTLIDTSVGDGATALRVHAVGAVIGERATVGPFAYLRAGTRLGAGGKIGTFVETKQADIAAGAKVPHLSYVGDADIGAGTNIGAGTIFANYDGVAKHHTSVGVECRTGANNTFVAPVSIGDGASTGAGTVVRRDVPPGALAVSSAPQRAVLDWVPRKRPGTPSAVAAEQAGAGRSEEEG